MKPTKPIIQSSIRAVAALAVAALAFASAWTARAAEVTHFSLRDKSASAVFFSTDTSSCSQGIESFVTVQGGLFVSKNGGTTETPLMSVQISVWDNCQNARVQFATGDTSQFELEIDPNLKKAKLKGTVVLQNHTTGADIIADVDLAWTSTDRADRGAFNDVVTEHGLTISSHSTGAIREALASGTIKVDTTDYTPEPSIVGYIQKNASHEITVTRE
jgi:hypothetical protein